MSRVKFNGFENYVIKQALNGFSSKMEAEVKQIEQAGNRSIYAPGFFDMICKDLINKVDEMTLKKDRGL
jgi:UDP-2,3-diacylglucosamine pyrophosphatase LpxH